tara:strand:+ start:276453 stop:277214 length:762 start_codon:yes stop_codon:yes gene_type:complete
MKFNNIILGLFLTCCSYQLQAAEIQIAAASNLRYVLSELIAQFDQKSGHRVHVSYAASGTLTTQIQHGAPFEVFLSADPYYVQHLSEGGLSEGAVIDFAQAQMVLFASTQSPLSLDANLLGLKSALIRGELNKVAIANPKHAPYGQVAQRLLEEAGIWQHIQSQLLIAENASQAIQFALTSQVDAGFVPYSYVLQPQIASQGRYIQLDATLPQQAVLIRGASDPAKQFLNFIQTEPAKAIFRAQGFIVLEKAA